MRFWESGPTRSGENSFLRDVYGFPDSLTNVESGFRVKHGVFSWFVVNLSEFPDGTLEVVFCHSPPFRLLETAWCLHLCPKANVNGQRGISLRLERDANDSGPEKVLISYRLGLGKLSNLVWFEAKESISRKGDFFQTDTSVLGHLGDFFTDGVNDVSVVCEIYVSYFQTASGSETAWSVSEIDESLPEDMSALLTSNRSIDAWIDIRGQRMGAHSSVLSARSTTLFCRLDGGSFRRSVNLDNPAVMQLSCSILCLKCVLSYMYTGSFDYVARNAHFSMGLYEIADELSLLPLRDLLYPDKKRSKSRIHIQDIGELYAVQFNVRSFFSNTTFKVDGIRRRNSSLRESLMIYKVGYLPNFWVAFKLKISGIGYGIHGETSVSLLDRCGRGVAATLLTQELDPSGSNLTAVFVLTPTEFMSCEVASSSITVRIAFRTYEMRHDLVRRFDLKAPSRGKFLEPWRWREQLSRDLKALLHSGYSSDVEMRVERRSFRAHHLILAARSPYFHSLFCEGNDASLFHQVDDMKPRMMWFVLNYVYCGTLSHFRDLTLGDFFELYRVSINYGLSSLAGITSFYLKLMTGELDIASFEMFRYLFI